VYLFHHCYRPKPATVRRIIASSEHRRHYYCPDYYSDRVAGRKCMQTHEPSTQYLIREFNIEKVEPPLYFTAAHEVNDLGWTSSVLLLFPPHLLLEHLRFTLLSFFISPFPTIINISFIYCSHCPHQHHDDYETRRDETTLSISPSIVCGVDGPVPENSIIAERYIPTVPPSSSIQNFDKVWCIKTRYALVMIDLHG
jgi:hypothetical protein